MLNNDDLPEEYIHLTEEDFPPDAVVEIMLTEQDIQQSAAEYAKQNPCLDFIDYADLKPTENMRFYDRLRQTIIEWTENKGMGSKYLEYILLAPDLFLLLIRLVIDDRVQPKLRMILAGVAAYFISPIDPMPEAILGPIGYLDDIVITALGILKLINDTDESIVREHWSGKGDIVEVIKRITSVGEVLVGSPLWRAMKRKTIDQGS